MIKMSRSPSGEAFSAVVIVAFDRTKGHVHATYVHGFEGDTDKGGVERARERLLKDLGGRFGSCADIELVQLPLNELEDGWIERVDPTTRNVVVRRGRDVGTDLTRP